MYFQFIRCVQEEIEERLEIDTCLLAEKLFHVTCCYKMFIGIGRVSDKLFQCREKDTIAYYIAKGVHKERAFAVNIINVCSLFIHIFSLHDRQLVFKIQ